MPENIPSGGSDYVEVGAPGFQWDFGALPFGGNSDEPGLEQFDTPENGFDENWEIVPKDFRDVGEKVIDNIKDAAVWFWNKVVLPAWNWLKEHFKASIVPGGIDLAIGGLLIHYRNSNIKAKQVSTDGGLPVSPSTIIVMLVFVIIVARFS